MWGISYSFYSIPFFTEDKTFLSFMATKIVWWVDLGWLPAAQPTSLFLPHFNRMGRKQDGKLMGQDKDREISYRHRQKKNPTKPRLGKN